jgi:hypothetical protein
MGGAALASVLHVAGCPLPSHHCCPIVVVQSPPSYRRPRNAAVIVINIVFVGSGSGIVTIAIPLPSSPLSPPSPSLPSSLTLLRRRCFIIVVSSCSLAANRRSWTKPLLPKLSTLVDCCLGWVAQHLQVFCMLLPPIANTSLSSHCCCQITRPRIAAVVIINIVAVGSGGGIIAVAVAVAVAISPIAIVAVIVNVALLTSLCHRR